MQLTATGQSEYYDGNEIGRYGLDLDTKERMLVWYNGGIRAADEPAWTMDAELRFRISPSIDTIVVVHQETHTAYALDRRDFERHLVTMDGREQMLAEASDEFVRELGDPNDYLRGELWIESGNEVNENYHQEKNH